MKKNITIAILAFLSILSLSFAYTQKLAADENLVLAERAEAVAREMEQRAHEQMMSAEVHMKQAEMARAEAELQRALAVQQAEKARMAK